MAGDGMDNSSSSDGGTSKHDGDGAGIRISNGNGGGHGHLCFQCLDLTHFRKALTKLHQVVTDGRGRIEVKRRGCDDVCVLISKAELESLEHALAILSETAAFQAMCEDITRLAGAAGPAPCSPTASA